MTDLGGPGRRSPAWATLKAASSVLRRPSARRHAGRAVQQMLIATAIPLLVFSVYQQHFGTTAAVEATAGWVLTITVLEAVRRRRLSGLLLLSLLMLSIKAAGGLITGSSFLFFAVPCAGTAVTGLVFAWSGSWSSPMLVRLARDVVPFLDGHLSACSSRPFVLRLSWCWGLAYIVNAVGSFLLLISLPLHLFMILHVAASWVCTAVAGSVSVLLARRHGPELLRLARGLSEGAAGQLPVAINGLPAA